MLEQHVHFFMIWHPQFQSVAYASQFAAVYFILMLLLLPLSPSVGSALWLFISLEVSSTSD